MHEALKLTQSSLKLVFRVFARQNMDISPLFSEVEANLRKFGTFIASDVREFKRPCFAGELEKAEKEGFLITKWSGKHYFVLREQEFVHYGPEPAQIMDRVVEAMPDTFVACSLQDTFESGIIGK